MKMSLRTAIACRSQMSNVKCEHVKCQMSNYQMSNVKRETLHVKCQNIKSHMSDAAWLLISLGGHNTSCNRMSCATNLMI